MNWLLIGYKYLRRVVIRQLHSVGIYVIFGYNIGEYMHLTTLRTVGGSVMFAIPKAILESLHLLPNTQVGLSVTEGRLIVEPHPRPHYTLAELVALCDLAAPRTSDDRAWLDAAPVGREEI